MYDVRHVRRAAVVVDAIVTLNALFPEYHSGNTKVVSYIYQQKNVQLSSDPQHILAQEISPENRLRKDHKPSNLVVLSRKMTTCSIFLQLSSAFSLTLVEFAHYRSSRSPSVT